MPKYFKIALAILTLSFIICVHELGHFGVCKLFSIRTPVFSLGFGPALLEKKIGATTFQVAALPLGGYVSIEVQDLDKAPYWQKMVITLAGIFNNFLFAYLLFILIFFINRKKLLPVIEKIKNDSPAQKADLQPKDHILNIEGIAVNKNNAEIIFETVQSKPHQEITLILERNGTILEKKITLSQTPLPQREIGYLGISLQKSSQKNFSFFANVLYAWQTLTTLMHTTFYRITGLFKPKKNSTPYLTHANLQSSVTLFLIFAAITSIELGVFNLLPIPLLDGGKAFSYTLEAIIGTYSTLTQNFIYLLLLIAFILYLNHKQNVKKQ